MADACTAAGLEVPRARCRDARGASTSTCRPTAPRRTRSMPRRRRCPRSATPASSELVLPSPMVDGVVLVMTARSAAQPRAPARGPGAPGRDDAEADPAWSYTLPAQKSVQVLSEAGLPLYTDIGNCARTMRVMADYRALRERFLRPIEVTSAACARQGLGARGAGGGRPGAVRVGGAADPRRLRHRHQSRRHAGAAPRRRPSRRPAPSAAPSRSRCSRRTSCTRRRPAPWR